MTDENRVLATMRHLFAGVEVLSVTKNVLKTALAGILGPSSI